MRKQALVTGGAGFIGSHLCDRLVADGWRVRVLDNLSTGIRDNLPTEAELLEGDICRVEDCGRACADVDAVFHLAARVTIRHSVETFYDDASVNLMGTLNMLRSAAEGGARRFVFASSMAVYADSPDGSPVSEEHPTTPLSPYGISKLAAERYVIMMGRELGLEPVALRLFNTYGPRQGYTPYVGVITIFITRILQGKSCTIFGDGEQCRDFVHVRDVARAFVLASTASGAPGRVMNVGTGRGTTVNEVAALVREVLCQGEFTHAAADATELRHSVPDINRACQLLGYRPEGILGERIADVVAAVKQRVVATGV